ncbi:MAG: ComF family protein [Rhodospirillales bacterium]|nr:ComF family protein [Rhodospirillales bacterium]MDP6645986.1 ComF family protein [Rhodospirillales bacterium]MDP6843418.1 ComF family protein [Rhodospirillales bacterium]
MPESNPRTALGSGTPFLRPLWERSLSALFPPQCLKCGAMMEADGALCGSCWPEVAFIGAPQCAACGRPFEYDIGEAALCGACARSPPRYGRARAVFVYDQDSRGLILAFKHADQTHAARTFARWLRRAGEEMLDAADCLVPVPLHWTRLFSRRFNQAALLAQALGRECGCQAVPRALIRRRRTVPHVRMSAAQRWRNVRGAFAVHPPSRARIEGKRIVLIDDVLTTGATVSTCADVLMRAGAANVDVLTLARVMRPEES